jgi:endonuclease/exonuclease/phosphatase family metal-dependent hydrolase
MTHSGSPFNERPGCLNNFTKDTELGFHFRMEGYSCALSPHARMLVCGDINAKPETDSERATNGYRLSAQASQARNSWRKK